MEGIILQKWLEAVIPPIVFLLILWAMLEPRGTRRAVYVTAIGFVAAEVVFQGMLYIISGSPELAFTQFPLTLYIPAIICIHILSRNGFQPTALIWLLGLLCVEILSAQRTLLTSVTKSVAGGWWALGGELIGAIVLMVLVYRHFRAPFRECAKLLEGGWPALIFLPVMLLALYSYFLASTTDTTALVLLFLTALAALLALGRLMYYLAGERRAKESQWEAETLRRECELLQKKLELGRSSRHDIRHHITALTALLQQGDDAGAMRYIAGVQGQLAQIETETWSRNTAVNGVLLVYLAQAREAGCALEVEVSLPEELPFEEIDLCVVLANALENAIHACEAAPAGAPREIKLNIALTGQHRLTFEIENSCIEPVTFDSAGFPVVPRRAGHGQGLRSIAAVVKKYHGLFQCEYTDGRFKLRGVLLDSVEEPEERRRVPAVCAGIFLTIFLINCMPATADALEAVPVLGEVIRVTDLRTYALRWGDTGVTVEAPELEGSAALLEEVAQERDAFQKQMQEEFLTYVGRKYQGYAAEDITYEVKRDDEALYTLCFRATLNAGGSIDYSRYITVDKGTGEILELPDLFLPDANYQFPISREIKAQMSERMKAGEGNYFLPGGTWPEEDCFESIAPDQNFYINEDGQIVIVFGEYEVGPGSMGEPEFEIPAEVVDGILAKRNTEQ